MGNFMMTPVHLLEMVARSNCGLVRLKNEDAVFADARHGLAILADGMGGYNAGEVASSMAVSRLAESLLRLAALGASEVPPGGSGPDAVAQHLGDEIGAVNSAIFHAAATNPHYAGMGTTLVVAWFYGARMSVAYLGDSRLYRWRRGRFEQLTRDHSLLQEQIDGGIITREEARHARHRNLVTRALGVDDIVEAEINDHEILPGDIVLLCSDGLTDMVSDADIAWVLQTQADNLSRAADELIELANANGGRDNVSIILVRAMGDAPRPGKWWQRLLTRLKQA